MERDPLSAELRKKWMELLNETFPLAKPAPVLTSHTEGSAADCEQVGETVVVDERAPGPHGLPADPPDRFRFVYEQALADGANEVQAIGVAVESVQPSEDVED